jgi:hypothetical protein
MNNIFSIILSVIILAALLHIFYRVYKRVRKGGSAATLTALGSTYDLHSKDEKRAIETIVELKAGKKLEEQESSDPLE